MSPHTVPARNDNSFTYYPPPGLISSSNSIMNASIDNMDFSSENLSRKNNAKDTLSVASAGATWSATASSINGESRKKSNPPVPKLDLSKLSAPTELPRKVKPSIDQKSIDAWQVKIERFPS